MILRINLGTDYPLSTSGKQTFLECSGCDTLVTDVTDPSYDVESHIYILTDLIIT